MQNNNTRQVEDDFTVLDMMMNDSRNAPALYRPTNYWAQRMEILAEEIKVTGLTDFRRRKNSVLELVRDSSAPLCRVDLKSIRGPNNRLFRMIPGWSRFLDSLSSRLSKAVVTQGELDTDGLYQLHFSHTELAGQAAPFAKPLSSVDASNVGNPEGAFEVGGKSYTLNYLECYLRYVFASHVIDFDKTKVVAELGSGMGRQVELLRKLHPNVSFLVFDIPPTIYLAERYLKSVFPDSVKTYRETRNMTDLSNLEPGGIYIFGAHDFPRIQSADIDVFWNAASFGEMEPDVVENYLSLVAKCSEYVFIHQAMAGKEVASGPGRPGVLKQTRRDHYFEFLPDFENVKEGPALTPLRGTNLYTDILFRRKT